jgi:hypothetical protein
MAEEKKVNEGKVFISVIFASTVQGSVSGHYEHVCLYFKRKCPVRGNVPRSAAHDHSDGHATTVTDLLRKMQIFDRIFISVAPAVTQLCEHLHFDEDVERCWQVTVFIFRVSA